MTRKYKVGDKYRIVGRRFSSGIAPTDDLREGREVVIEDVDHGVAFYSDPIGHNLCSTDFWELKFVREGEQQHLEGGREWAAQQVLAGKPVVLDVKEPGIPGYTVIVRTFEQFLSVVANHPVVGLCWSIYVETPPEPYVAEVGTELWALAMIMEKNLPVRSKSTGKVDSSEHFVSNYLGLGYTWELA